MDPITAGFLASLILGGGMTMANIAGQEETNRINVEMTDKANKLAQKLNDPVYQAERLKAVGLNPAAYMGAPRGTSIEVPNITNPYSDLRPENLLSAMTTAQNIETAQQQIKNLKQEYDQAQKVNQENYNILKTESYAATSEKNIMKTFDQIINAALPKDKDGNIETKAGWAALLGKFMKILPAAVPLLTRNKRPINIIGKVQ